MATTYEKHLAMQLKKISDEAQSIAVEMEAKFKETNEVSSELKEKFENLCVEGKRIREAIEALNGLKEMSDFVNNPIEQKHRLPNNERKSLGQQIFESENYSNAIKSGGAKQNFVVPITFKNWKEALEAKATFSATGTGLTNLTQGQSPILLGTQPLTVRDLLASGQTGLISVPYMQEVSHVNAAETVAEGATKPEASFDLVEASAPVKKIAVTAKVTDETFKDFPTLESYINNRLMFMVSQTEESQLLNGNGVSPNLTGILQTAGIQTQAKGVDSAIDAIHKGLTKIRSIGFFEPDALVIHPNDWQEIRLSKDANGQYYGGGPFAAMFGDNLWSKRVVVTTAIAEGTALVGAFSLGGQIFDREGMMIEMTNSNEDDFKKNLIAIRAEERLALAVYRPKAFCTITGI